MPKTNGTKPVVNTPSVQINAINERDTRPSPAPIASSASTPNIIQDIPNENGPMLTTIQNHSINANDNSAAKRDIQVKKNLKQEYRMFLTLADRNIISCIVTSIDISAINLWNVDFYVSYTA